MHHVILGAGPAGVTAAETVRAQSPNAEITLISGEPEAPYSRMAIPYLLHGDIAEQGTHLRQSPGHYDTLGIKLMHGRAGAIEPRSQVLSLSGGANLKYDRLLIATGASPILPPIGGSNLPGVHTCWTLADAREILKHAERGKPVVLVGAGFIGSIVLEALYARGCELTVVEIAPRMVARMMDETAGGMLGRWCEAKGVRVLVDTKVENIAQSGDGDAPLAVSVSSGSTLPANLVVLAAGVRPNAGFLVGSDVLVRSGIRVDDFMHTSTPHIYAAGDCCEAIDLSTGAHDVLAIQPTAVEHGRIAALNMTGTRTPHRGSLNMNVLDTMGLISSSFGLWQGTGSGDTAAAIDHNGYRYMRLQFDDDKLVGAQCVGMTDHIGILRGLIQTGLRLGAWKERLKAAPERVPEAYVAIAQGAPAAGPTGPRVKLPN
ncbi:MAG: NAD(P)/FAD-dependent oxidoreductase [Hyphomicrobiaceae bacterium]|nr:NAD(P)/FAD-dependent oxidoreductase [Hyphomicrobiaceae bacterium]